MSDSDKKAAVYLPWATFQNTIMNGFAQGLPNVIDKSLFPGQSGAVQGQIMAGLKFLGLIEENGKPTKTLHSLMDADPDGRKQVIARVIKERYAEVFAIGIEKATMQQLSDTMAAKYSVSGDTREKAVRFFLAACKFAGITVSPHLAKGTTLRKRPSGPRRPRVEQQPTPTPQTQPPPPSVPLAGGAPGVTSQTITLTNGGKVTLSVSVDVIKLRGEDRDFVFELIDKLDDYEKKHAKVSASATSTDDAIDFEVDEDDDDYDDAADA